MTQCDLCIQCNPVKIPTVCFANIERNHPKNHMGTQENTNGQKIFEKESKLEELTIPDFNAYCKAIVIKILY